MKCPYKSDSDTSVCPRFSNLNDLQENTEGVKFVEHSYKTTSYTDVKGRKRSHTKKSYSDSSGKDKGYEKRVLDDMSHYTEWITIDGKKKTLKDDYLGISADEFSTLWKEDSDVRKLENFVVENNLDNSQDHWKPSDEGGI